MKLLLSLLLLLLTGLYAAEQPVDLSAKQVANMVLAGPTTGAPAVATYRFIVNEDFGTGIWIVGHGGTGLTTLTSHAIQVGNGTGNMTQLAAGANGQFLIGNTGGDPVWSSTPTLGVTGNATGLISFKGFTSGTVVLTVNAAAGSYNFILPNGFGTNGQVLTSTGSATSWTTLSTAPTGAAGGDLSGTYPNPTVLSIANVTTGPTTYPAGSGLNLTNINATNLASGTVADARLSANVPLLNVSNTFSGGLNNVGFSFFTSAVNSTSYQGDGNRTGYITLGQFTNTTPSTQIILGTQLQQASSGTDVGIAVTPVFNQTSTAAYTALKINVTETAVGSGAHILTDWQVGSTSKVTMNNAGTFTVYNGVNTAAWGVPAIYGSGRNTGQTAAAANIATYTSGADGSYLVSANVLLTTPGTLANFTCTCSYKSEDGVPRVLTMPFVSLAGTSLTAIVSATTLYEGVPVRIRAQSGTAIHIDTVGTFTGCTYNVEADISQVK